MITTYEQTTATGKTRTMYTATVDKTTYHADSIERLEKLINNHTPENEGTF